MFAAGCGTGVSSPGAGQGDDMENLRCPVDRTPLSNLAGRIQRKGRADTVGARLAAGVAGRLCVAKTSRLGDSTPDFLLGFTPLALSTPVPPTRQWGHNPDKEETMPEPGFEPWTFRSPGTLDF